MVVGSGLLAMSFRSYLNNTSVLIFASGVSNSRSVNEADYNRECELLKSFSDFSGIIVYFSTCSIYDPSLKGSRYIKHKLELEEYIRNTHNKYLIVRLPNIIGAGTNPHTMTNFIYNSILQETKFSVHLNATRYLLHVDDVYTYVDALVSKYENLQNTVNLALYAKISVLEIVKEFESYLNRKANIELIEAGSTYDVVTDKLFSDLGVSVEPDSITALQKMIARSYPKNH